MLAVPTLLALFAATPPAAPAPAVESTVARGDDVDVTSGAVTALSCALDARDKGDLAALSTCPLEEATKEIVVFDVAEKQIYRLDKKKVRRSELEKAFGGGSLDFTGKVASVDKNGIASVVVDAHTVTPKPKAGSFKGCL